MIDKSPCMEKRITGVVLLLFILFSFSVVLSGSNRSYHKVMTSDQLLTPRILMAVKSSHDFHEFKINSFYSFKTSKNFVPKIKLNEVLLTRNRLQLVLGPTKSTETTFELRIYADYSKNGAAIPYDLTEMDAMKSTEFEVLYKFSWGPDAKKPARYPVKVTKNFDIPKTLKNIKWQKPEFQYYSNSVDIVGSPFLILVNGKQLYTYEDFKMGEIMMPVKMTNWSVMNLLKKGSNQVQIQLPTVTPPMMANDAEFRFLIYPVLPDADADLKSFNWTETARRSLIELVLTNPELKKLTYPYEKKGNFTISSDLEKAIKSISE
jgi:hypothetical protein